MNIESRHCSAEPNCILVLCKNKLVRHLISKKYQAQSSRAHLAALHNVNCDDQKEDWMFSKPMPPPARKEVEVPVLHV